MSPKTEGGKAVVRWNSTRHGISSPAPVVPGLEQAEDWPKQTLWAGAPTERV